VSLRRPASIAGTIVICGYVAAMVIASAVSRRLAPKTAR
jgi:hypothetical protein